MTYVSSSALRNQSASSIWCLYICLKASLVLAHKLFLPSFTGKAIDSSSGSVNWKTEHKWILYQPNFFEKWQLILPSLVLMNRSRLHRLPHVRLTWRAFFWWFFGVVIIQHSIFTSLYNCCAIVLFSWACTPSWLAWKPTSFPEKDLNGDEKQKQRDYMKASWKTKYRFWNQKLYLFLVLHHLPNQH